MKNKLNCDILNLELLEHAIKNKLLNTFFYFLSYFIISTINIKFLFFPIITK